MLGNGCGEYAAALAAGMITLEDALKLLAVQDSNSLKLVAESITYQSPRLGFISRITGEMVTSEGITADYWTHHREPTAFDKGIDSIKSAGCDDLLDASELGSWQTLLKRLAKLYLSAIPIDWKGFDAPYQRKKVALPTYPFQRQRYWAKALEKVSTPQENMFLELAWEPKALETSSPISLSGSWALFSDDSLLAKALVEKIGQAGGICFLIQPGGAFAKKDDHRFVCDPLNRADFATLWDGLGVIQGVIFLWGNKVENLAKAHELSCGGALSLVQSLAARGKLPPLAFITRGGIPQENPVNLGLAPLAGLQRTIVEEYPDAISVQIDFDADEDPAFEAEQVLQEIAQRKKENQVVWRKGVRHIARLKPAALPSAPKPFDFNGCYLITGGMSGSRSFICKTPGETRCKTTCSHQSSRS